MILDMKNAKEREEEYVALLERAYREIEENGLDELVNHVVMVRRAIARTRTKPSQYRVPYGLVMSQDINVHHSHDRQIMGLAAVPDPRIAEDKQVLMLTQPQCVSRFTHLVVTEDTAQSFVLEDFKIGKNSQLLGALDLTFFSMKYQESDVLSDIFRMPGDTVEVSQIVSLYVRRKFDGRGPKNFNGILWAEFDLDLP